MQRLDDAGDLVERTDRITAGALAEQLRAPAPPVLVDVRTASEWTDAHIDGAVNLPLAQLTERVGELPSDRAMVLYCGSGYRSAIATSSSSEPGLKPSGQPEK